MVAVPMVIGVVASVLSRKEADDDALLCALKAGYVIRIQGQVQESRLPTEVFVVPGVVVGSGNVI